MKEWADREGSAEQRKEYGLTPETKPSAAAELANRIWTIRKVAHDDRLIAPFEDNKERWLEVSTKLIDQHTADLRAQFEGMSEAYNAMLKDYNELLAHAKAMRLELDDNDEAICVARAFDGYISGKK